MLETLLKESPDDHVIKLVHTCHEEFELTQDKTYLAMAEMKSGV